MSSSAWLIFPEWGSLPFNVPDVSLIDWLGFGLVGGLVGGLIGGLGGGVRDDKVSPNQGIMLSLKNGLVTSGGIAGLWLVLETFFELQHSTVAIGSLFFLWLGGLLGLKRGGSAVVKHYSLRLILWLTGATPFRFIPFLDHCAKLILLKKVGGGYIFIHRTLLEYFAGLPSAAHSVQTEKPQGVMS